MEALGACGRETAEGSELAQQRVWDVEDEELD